MPPDAFKPTLGEIVPVQAILGRYYNDFATNNGLQYHYIDKISCVFTDCAKNMGWNFILKIVFCKVQINVTSDVFCCSTRK